MNQIPIDFKPLKAHFNGSDYVPERDDHRLGGQQLRIWELMCDGAWRTLREIAEATHAPEASISAQLRHLRKPRFGSFLVDKKHDGAELYHYRLRAEEREPLA